jgi:hypothetical protein
MPWFFTLNCVQITNFALICPSTKAADSSPLQTQHHIPFLHYDLVLRDLDRQAVNKRRFMMKRVVSYWVTKERDIDVSTGYAT